ncbi:MAG: hypothetical protein ACPGEG_05145 [Salibacteraceae bacterium]
MRIITTVLCVFTLLMLSGNIEAQKKKGSNKKHSSSKGDVEAAHLEMKDACKKLESLEKIKADMSPYRFDKVNTTKVFYKAYDKVVTVAIPLFHSTGYKFIINTEGLPTKVDIKITDKPLAVNGAKILHQSTETHFIYEAPKDFEGTRIYVSFKIPADAEFNTGVRNKGCVLIGSGYQNLDF